MRRILSALLFVLCLVSFLAVPLLALTQATPPAIGAGLLAGFAPILTTLLTSGITWVANQFLGAIRDWSSLAKYAVMGAIGVVVSVVFAAIGHSIPSDTSTWTALTAQGAAAAAVAALVFKVGKASR